MTLADGINRLVYKFGSLRAVAAATGIDHAYLSRLRSGVKLAPGPEVLDALGLEQIVSYRVKSKRRQK